MSFSKQVDIQSANLHCRSCKNFLSKPPITLSPDGTNSCGACLPKKTAGPYRNFGLEAVLSKMAIPCKFASKGCGESLAFNKTDTHENRCGYRTCACRPLSEELCMWEGLMQEFPEHFIEEHTHLVKEELSFQFRVDKNKTDVFMFVADDDCAVFKFVYHANLHKVVYEVGFVSTNVDKAASVVAATIRLTNDRFLKVNSCGFVDDEFCLDELLQPLVKGKLIITLVLNVTLAKFANPQEELKVNYDLLEGLRCRGCKDYLRLPLYDCNVGIVCGFCKKKFEPSTLSTNNQLTEYIKILTYPCRWRGCTFVEKFINVQEHESTCRLRVVYECFLADCSETFELHEATEHFTRHGYEYFSDQFVYEAGCLKSAYDWDLNQPLHHKRIFSMVSCEIITIEYTSYYVDLFSTGFAGEKYHSFILNSRDDNNVAKFTVQFGHSHCANRSRLFNISEKFSIFYTTDFPPCFKFNEPITLTIKVAEK